MAFKIKDKTKAIASLRNVYKKISDGIL